MQSHHTPEQVCDIRIGQDIAFDAWLYSMLMDNNLAHVMNPDIIASPEQLAFMVQLEENQVYLPCSDTTFRLMVCGDSNLQRLYNRAWRIIIRLIRSLEEDRVERKRIILFCRHRFKQYIAQRALIPSRLVKRMTSLVLAQCYCQDPWIQRRRAATIRQEALLKLPAIRDSLDAMPENATLYPKLYRGIDNTRLVLDMAQATRLLYLSCMNREWEIRDPERDEVVQGMRNAEDVAGELRDCFAKHRRNSTILLVSDADGGTYTDLCLAQQLICMGYRVIYTVKDGFHFYAPTMDDMLNDPTLEKLLQGAHILKGKSISKNDLLKLLREFPLVIINDGTRERLNLCRVSVAFSRAWKEADLIICKGWRTAELFLGTSHQFTRDIMCYWRDEQGFHLNVREQAPNAHKFSESDIRAQADTIIKEMKQAHKDGRSVMFYSCIIGSIPGQTSVAITLAKIFVNNLRNKTDNVYILNPAEHFVEGMDGDDLMYMWERVQRSGYIDTWHFQTAKDIAESFALLGRKVPPAWMGKDATYSTGCTKEMRIALDVQSKNKEMQIIGPDPHLFFRRSEYGVGKYFDAKLTGEG